MIIGASKIIINERGAEIPISEPVYYQIKRLNKETIKIMKN